MTTGQRLFWPFVGWGALCVAAMFVSPGQETIPYHLGYAGLGLAAGLDTWSRGRSVLALGGYTVATGAVLVSRAADGVIAWEETSEIPLMCLLLGLVLWHIGRRNVAITRVSRLVEREQSQMARRERLVRTVSHEMRTPLAIAGGYVDLLRGQALPASAQDDLIVVREELDRSSRAVDMLLRLIRSHENLPLMDLDLDHLLEELVERWRVVADRDWRIEASVGIQKANADRVRACIDTLVENAVRYTAAGDVIRVFGWVDQDTYVVGVADSGPGFTADQVAAINAPTVDDADAPLVSDPRSQTGLGLSLVRDAVEWRGGRLLAGRGREGGAEMRVVCPRHSVGLSSIAMRPVTRPIPVAALVEVVTAP
jgi:two-component system, OmpR family, sensor kinase